MAILFGSGGKERPDVDDAMRTGDGALNAVVMDPGIFTGASGRW